MRAAVPRSALATPFRSTTVREIARQVLWIARKGLRERRRINRASQDESVYLEPLQEVVASGRTLADELIARFEGPLARRH